MRRFDSNRFAWFIVLAYLVLAFVNATLNPHGLWDFDVYWVATRTWLAGGDPYLAPASGGLAQASDEPGETIAANPLFRKDAALGTSLSFVAQLVSWFAVRFAGGVPSSGWMTAPVVALWTGLTAGLVLASARVVPGLTRSGPRGLLHLIFLTCALYAAVAPRMNPYAYTILILPAFHALGRITGASPVIALILFMAPIRGSLPTWGPGPWDLAQDFFPLLLAWIAFGVLWLEARQAARAPAPGCVPEPGLTLGEQ